MKNMRRKHLNIFRKDTSDSIMSFDIPGLISKSSLLVLATVLVACVGNVDTQENAKQDKDQNIELAKNKKEIGLNSPEIVAVREIESRTDSSNDEVIVTGSRRIAEEKFRQENETQRVKNYPVLADKPSAPAKLQAERPRLLNSNPRSMPVAASSVKSNVALSSSGLAVGTNQSLDYMGSSAYQSNNRENYAEVEESQIKLVTEEPVSTFSVDVDTGSYTNVRRMLNQGHLPPADAVRVEEFINYFDYNYKTPRNTKDPFAVTTELSQTPWNANSKLLKVGLKAYEVDASERPAANLVFLMDVSGSMNSANKLPLLIESFKMLTQNLNADDSVAIVVYAGASGVVLEPTQGDNKRQILDSLNRLRAGGSTNGAAGIQLAYKMAEEAFIDDGINRIILATDGDFNVGTTGVDALKRLVEDKRKSGISLTTLGFGSGNYNDHLMEQIADVGNGNNAYIDSVQEAEKVLVTEMNSTLLTVAKDVKIQIEFNPQQVSEYRLIGYENRALKREDFNNDKVDAGEIGAGHTVTAIYEVFLSGSKSQSIDPLRYSTEKTKAVNKSNELAFVKLRFKYPDADKSEMRSFAVKSKDEVRFSRTSKDFKFSTAVSAFGQKLKRSKYIGDFSFADISELAEDNTGHDKHGYRDEFVELVERASELSRENPEHLMSEY